MLDYGFANFALISPNTDAASVPVKLGMENSVAVVPGGDTRLLIDKSQRSSVTTTVELEPFVTAPVSQGQRLGMLTIRSGEQILAQVPMVAKTAVLQKSWMQIFLSVLKAMTMSA